MSWGSVSGATSYTLQEQVNGGSWATIQTSNAASKALSGKANGTYGYQVQACNAGGCGPWSATGAITVALVPAAPSGVEIVYEMISSKRERYSAQWNAVSGATSYQARRADTGAVVYNNVGTSFVIAEGNIPVNLTLVYDVQVRACNAAGCSGWVP